MPAGSKLRRLRDIAPWLPGYLADSSRRAKRRDGLEYIILCFVDHFEPSWGRADEVQAALRLQYWLDTYPKVAATIYDCTGRTLPHSWFYPFDEARESELSGLSELVFGGWGEIDLHLHHFNDTADGLRQKLRDALAMFRRYGALHDITGRPSFGFIHGNWALGNSIPAFCGVDDELPILREFGCYGDFTFPAPNRCQPHRTNRIYTAAEKPPRPFEYGGELGTFPAATLPIIQGPLRLGKIGGRWRVDDGEVDAHNPFSPTRLKAWTAAGITVAPQHQWGFVKIFTHGAPEHSADEVLDRFLPKLPEAIDQLGLPVVFATARELLNMAYAAAAGKTGNPADYRDSYLTPPLGRHIRAEGGAHMELESDDTMKLTKIGTGRISVTSTGGGAITVDGPIQSLSWDHTVMRITCTGEIKVSGNIAAPEIRKGSGEAGVYRPADNGELWLQW